VLIGGTNLIEVQSVQFNGIEARFGFGTIGELIAIVPEQASSGPITVVTGVRI
jgi:hypothetical protein